MYECFLEIAFEAELNTKEDPELLELAPELCNEDASTRATAVTNLRNMIFGTPYFLWYPSNNKRLSFLPSLSFFILTFLLLNSSYSLSLYF